MLLTLRRRVVLSLLACLVIGGGYTPWALQLSRNLFRAGVYDSRILVCTADWRQWGYQCPPEQFDVVRSSILLLLVTALVLAALAALVLWSGRPLRRLALTMRRFGPQNLAERTELAHDRSQVARLAGEVDDMLDRVAAGYEGQRRFAANASHELRTLATQRALIEVGLAASPTPDQLDLLTRQLLDTNERNELLIEGLLVLAETDQGLSSRTPQRLDALAADTVAGYARQAADAGVALRSELEPVTVVGEAALLERLISNLVHNAIKYNDRGGEVCVRVRADQPVLVVTNTGPVVAAESVSRLFEPFRRARGDRLDHSGGVGLGLTIARSITTAHSGLIAARAQPAGGLEVAVELPVDERVSPG